MERGEDPRAPAILMERAAKDHNEMQSEVPTPGLRCAKSAPPNSLSTFAKGGERSAWLGAALYVGRRRSGMSELVFGGSGWTVQ